MNTVRKYDILRIQDELETNISRNKLEEITRDPFGLGNDVKGLATMSKLSDLYDYALELVANYAKYECEEYTLSFKSLSDFDQSELCRLYIEYSDRDISECVFGNDFSINNEYTCALLSMLENNSPENIANFAEVTRNNTIIYFQDSLQEIIDKQCDLYLHGVMNNQRFYAQRDREHGDVVWGKF